MISRIHINQHKIKANKKYGTRQPVITAKRGRLNLYGNRVDIVGDDGTVYASIIYSPDKPLNCGATCWVESNFDIKIDGRVYG